MYQQSVYLLANSATDQLIDYEAYKRWSWEIDYNENVDLMKMKKL